MIIIFLHVQLPILFIQIILLFGLFQWVFNPVLLTSLWLSTSCFQLFCLFGQLIVYLIYIFLKFCREKNKIIYTFSFSALMRIHLTCCMCSFTLGCEFVLFCASIGGLHLNNMQTNLNTYFISCKDARYLHMGDIKLNSDNEANTLTFYLGFRCSVF